VNHPSYRLAWRASPPIDHEAGAGHEIKGSGGEAEQAAPDLRCVSDAALRGMIRHPGAGLGDARPHGGAEKPGHSAFTSMLCGARCNASLRVRLTMAPFGAAWAGRGIRPAGAARPHIEATVMILRALRQHRAQGGVAGQEGAVQVDVDAA
jgi:hypothetical protein